MEHVSKSPQTPKKEENQYGAKTLSAPAFQLKADPIQAKKVYRGMTDGGGVPATGESKRKLGVTMPDDLDVDQKGIAKHNNKGMSTSPDSPMNLPEHRRDKEWEGTGKDPVWEIDESKLHTDLLDWHEDKPGKHGIVRPKKDMPYTTFKAALEGTQTEWKRAKK